MFQMVELIFILDKESKYKNQFPNDDFNHLKKKATQTNHSLCEK